MTNIVNVSYHSTNYFAIDVNQGKLLVDCGWPETMPQFTAELRRKGIVPSDIKYVLATHFHPDHAGLVGEFKKLGAKLILMESQVGALNLRPSRDIAKMPSVIDVSRQSNIELSFAGGRQFLASLGLEGEVIPTPGHSDDSVTLILDDGIAFTGDLPPRFAIPEDDEVTKASWDRIYQHNITQIHPAHGG